MNCIYKIVNLLNNHCYIGSTIDFNKRKKRHFSELSKNKHHSIYLQRAYNKYGKEHFIVCIIEICETEEILKDRENYYLNKFNPEYNVSLDATAPMRFRKHTEETKKKFKNRKVNKTFGIKWTDEVRKKILEKRIGQKRSDTFKKLQSTNAIKNNQIRFIDRDKCKKKIKDSLDNIFDSLVEAAKYHSISVATVCDILKGRHSKTRKGISFIYA